MSKYVIAITTDNSAFEDSEAGEVGRILRQLANEIINNGSVVGGQKLYDFNGNAVGVVIKED